MYGAIDNPDPGDWSLLGSILEVKKRKYTHRLDELGLSLSYFRTWKSLTNRLNNQHMPVRVEVGL